jgi:UDP-N-acetyl-2-amino-2-deoxyglucuronate dehydrogenase
MQMRLHPLLRQLRTRLSRKQVIHDVTVTYVTPRGPWYGNSWKSDVDKSGGIALNIGIHLFDLLVWLFGEPVASRVYCNEPRRMSGFTQLRTARVRWFLSICEEDLARRRRQRSVAGHRSIIIDGSELALEPGIDDLHVRTYREILRGRGFSISDILPTLSLIESLRHASVTPFDTETHPWLTKVRP